MRNITLAWDSGDTNSMGYAVYYGGVSGVYTNVVFSGSATNVVIAGLTVGTTYYFAATAVDASGVESPYSGEIAFQVPSPPPPVTFTAPSAASFSASGFTLNFSSPVGCNCVVQASTDLIHWQDVASLVATNANSSITDPDAGNFPNRFYRAFVQ